MTTKNTASQVYNIPHWSDGYIDISSDGEVLVQPHRQARDTHVRLPELIRQLTGQGIALPVLIRFTDILHDRVNTLCQSFNDVAAEHGYRYVHSGNDDPDFSSNQFQGRTVEDDAFDETFTLSRQGAHDRTRYRFFEDVRQVEEIVSEQGRYGYIVLLTNDSNYWTKPPQSALYDGFRIHEGVTREGVLNWSEIKP